MAKMNSDGEVILPMKRIEGTDIQDVLAKINVLFNLYLETFRKVIEEDDLFDGKCVDFGIVLEKIYDSERKK